jgi:hypothetical protein
MHGPTRIFWANLTPFSLQGLLRKSNGASYDGAWRFDKQTGQATIVDGEGNRYVGQCTDGLPQGDGVFEKPDGPTYSGTWRGGKRHGQVRVMMTSLVPPYSLHTAF